MAGAGYKLFNTGDVLTAAQVNTYLQEQAVMVFADASARTTALSGVLAEGMITYLKSDDKVYKYTGSAWVEVGGGSSPLTTKGDLYTYSTADARLAVGTNGQYLSADSAEATGLKWVTPAGSAVVKLASGTISGTSMSFDNVFSSTYNNYYLFWNCTDTDGAQRIRLRVSGADNTTANYMFVNQSVGFGGTPAFSNLSNSSGTDYWLDLPVGSAGNRYSWQIGFTGFIDGSLLDQFSYQGFFNRRTSHSGVAFGSFAAGTNFDGFTVYNTGSTFSGTYALYAYNK
jgi:hypothetical protein